MVNDTVRRSELEAAGIVSRMDTIDSGACLQRSFSTAKATLILHDRYAPA